MAQWDFNARSDVQFNPLQQLMQGYQVGNGMQEAAQKRVQQQALQEAGQLYAAGDLSGAQAAAARGGSLQALMGFGQMANSERDFQRSVTNDARAQGNTDRSFGFQEKQFKATIEGQKMPAGFEPNPAGGVRPVVGGPQDPKYIKEVREGPKMSINDITKLSEEGGKLTNLTGFITEFKPEYGGMMGGATGGNAATWLSRTLPSEIQGQVALDRTNWWQGYDAYKNKVRNDLFGSALTPSEQGEWLKSDIHPGMNPEIIAKNLARQKEIVERAVKNKAGAIVQQGYSADVVGKAYGLTPEQLGVRPAAAATGGPVKVGSPQERDALPSGTQYIAPDGSIRTKP